MHTDELRGSESFSEAKVTQPLEKFPANYAVRRFNCYAQEKWRNISYYALPSI